MKSQRSSWVLYTIIITIAITIGVQVYWNYKNYQVNKQQFINQVQISLDNAVEAYYADFAKREKMMLISMNADEASSFKNLRNINFDSIFSSIEAHVKTGKDTIFIDTRIDPELSRIDSLELLELNNKFNIQKLLKSRDSIRMFNQISSLYISISKDSLNFDKLKTFLDTEFERKQIELPYRLNQYYHKKIVGQISNQEMPNDFLRTNSKSAYLKPSEKLELQYANVSKAVWKESIFGVFLSTLLSFAIIMSLLYLLRVIRRQKQLAEIKNDLISNITHEFKTPITTISTALEAIQHFDVLKDPERAQKYVSISDNQLKKLHLMVEKLLETATLDSENLLLKKETLNVVDFVEKIVNKQRALSSEKTISFRSNIDNLSLDLDPFHFENAITNLIDNALKYGGNTIEVHVAKVLETTEIKVTDNGNMIDKSQREKIFDKFYRIPKGNTHDVKGFGIGLYYTKKIIEKHNGTIQLIPDPNHTIFKITLLK